ncbi:MAG: GlsB/YeaQ/YmgE family stress response membrane protein [Janthinobacterium lividum]
MPVHGFIGWIVVGLIVGAIAKIFTPGPSGCIATILIGIAGLIASVLGAVVLLAVARLVTGRN